VDSVAIVAKKCHMCAQLKPLAEFMRQPRGKYGVAGHCRECEHERYLERRHITSARQKAHREQHRERLAAIKRQWRQDNPEKYREQARAYKLARKARERGARTETVLLSVLIERDRARCQICGKVRGKDRWSIDHIVPLSKGGANTYANTQLAHIRCNRKRWNVGPAQLRMFGILG